MYIFIKLTNLALYIFQRWCSM